MLKLLSKLPFFVLYLFSDLLSFIAFYLIRYRKKVVFDNLSKSFPEKSDREIKKIARSFYTNLSDVIVEMIKSLSLGLDDIQERVIFNNKEVLNDQFNQGRSVFCMAAHMGNWEWILYGFHVNFNHPVDAVYKPLTNKKIDKLMYENRSRFGCTPIPKKNSAKEIIKRSREVVRAIALVADQVPLRSEEKYWTQFLNRETAFFVGTEALARLTNNAVACFAIRRVKRGFYEVDSFLIGEPPYEKGSHEVIEKYARKMEEYIKRYSSDWLWSHKRWKYTRKDVE